jgi:hypothetical protein
MGPGPKEEKKMPGHVKELLDQCMRHRRDHETRFPSKETCISILTKLRNVLPRLMKTYCK